MVFHHIKKIEKAQTYLDIAVRRALKHKSKKKQGASFDKAKLREYDFVGIIRDSLCSKLRSVMNDFPVLDDLPMFYSELLRVTLDYDKLKKSLSSIGWAVKKVQELARSYRRKIRETSDFKHLDAVKKAFLGRVCSVVNQVDKDLECLEHARLVMKDYPVIKPGIFTVCIAGFPNVGKTTLLSRLTSSVPEIKAYPFTTKRLNLGYASLRGKEVQFIDTPGTLARPNKMNSIEKQAYLAMKHLADVIIYVFDLTEPYPLADQKRLLGRISRLGKPVITYLSKTDVLERSVVEEFSKKEGAILTLNKLREEISRRILESN